jgi:hypothetical protein
MFVLKSFLIGHAISCEVAFYYNVDSKNTHINTGTWRPQKFFINFFAYEYQKYAEFYIDLIQKYPLK